MNRIKFTLYFMAIVLFVFLLNSTVGLALVKTGISEILVKLFAGAILSSAIYFLLKIRYEYIGFKIEKLEYVLLGLTVILSFLWIALYVAGMQKGKPRLETKEQ